MIPSLLGFNDNEENRGLPINLQLVTVYSYSDSFIIKLSMAIQRVRTNLVIHKKSATVNTISNIMSIQIGRNQPPRGIRVKAHILLFWGCLPSCLKPISLWLIFVKKYAPSKAKIYSRSKELPSFAADSRLRAS